MSCDTYSQFTCITSDYDGGMESVLAIAALGTATLSGVFGMAGGLLLFGVYTAILPVATAVVVHSGTQLLSNVSRVAVQRRWVMSGPVAWFAVGALAVYAAFSWWVPRLEPAPLFTVLGASVLGSFLVPQFAWMDASRPRGAALAGAVTTAAQLTGGVGGPLMDVFWVGVEADRRAVVATKALTQALAHVLRIAFWAPLVVGIDLETGALLGIAAGTMVGTLLGSLILDRLGEREFRRWTRGIVVLLGLGYLGRGLSLWVA